jgi:hypothetical protein
MNTGSGTFSKLNSAAGKAEKAPRQEKLKRRSVACGKPLGETRAPNIGEQLSMLCLLAKKAKGPDFLSSSPLADLPGLLNSPRQMALLATPLQYPRYGHVQPSSECPLQRLGQQL